MHTNMMILLILMVTITGCSGQGNGGRNTQQQACLEEAGGESSSVGNQAIRYYIIYRRLPDYHYDSMMQEAIIAVSMYKQCMVN